MSSRAEQPRGGGDRFVAGVHRTVRKLGMLRPGMHVVAAVSGGADSTALLYALAALRPRLAIRLTAAHLDHRIRGEEAEADARFVAELCETVGVPLVASAQDVAAQAAAAGANLEEAAREARYGWLRQTAALLAADRVALGHTIDDQAETVLMRLVRGSGVDGAAGIFPVVDATFVRPLLETSRREVLAYLESLGARWREDSTNSDLSLARNRIRRELIPYLEAHFNPAVVEALARSADAAREAGEFLDSEAARALAEIGKATPQGIALDAPKLAALHPALSKLVLRAAVRAARGDRRRITARHLAALMDLSRPRRSGRRIALPGWWEARREFGVLHIERYGRLGTTEEALLPVPGSALHSGWEVETRLVPPPERPPRSTPLQALLDADLLPGPLQLRTRRPGDRYGTGQRKLKKVLIDARVPLRERDRRPVVVSGGVVVWVPGLLPPRRFAPRGTTRRCLVLEARPSEVRLD